MKNKLTLFLALFLGFLLPVWADQTVVSRYGGGSGGIKVGDSPTLTGTWTFNGAVTLAAASSLNAGLLVSSTTGSIILTGGSATAGGIRFGPADGTDGTLRFSTIQTPDTIYFGTQALGNSIIIAESSDNGFDFAHALATDPTLWIHSHNQSTTQWFGLFHDASNAVLASGTGTLVWRASNASNNYWYSDTAIFDMVSGYQLGWISSATNAAGNPDTFFTREAAAIIQHGADLNGAAIAQTEKACDGITGSDIAGCDYTLAGGRGTGIGAPGDVHLQTGKDLATGTTAQTLFDRHFYRGKAKALTESSATTFITFNIPTSLTAVGGEVRYCVHATDGTEVQERCGDEDFACINKAGTVTASTPNLLGTEATVIPSGTLTNTITMTTSGTTCSMQANAASSLTQTILDIRYSVEIQGSATVTP